MKFTAENKIDRKRRGRKDEKSGCAGKVRPKGGRQGAGSRESHP